ncbi:hypothetical protein [Micromonospora sp. URMC 103]|uniref:hypothetical protein n=1 Tax=Micromonospora sp. URMC 103 TaxID=3423406 RepID=UPI003F1980B5
MLASVPWIVVLLGVLTLATLLLVASLSFRVREPEPVAASVPPLALPIPPAQPSASASTSASASPTPARSRATAATRPSRGTARPTTGAPRPPRPSSAPAAEQPAPLVGGTLTATYRVRDADRYDVEAELDVHNGTGGAEEWTVRLTFSGRVRDVEVFAGTGVRMYYRGDGQYVLRGTSRLGTGRSVELGLRYDRSDRDDRLVGCTVNGNDCAVG